jgi:hypothetical protein
MEDYILPILRYLFGNNNNTEELSDLEKSIDSPNFRDKYFDISYNFDEHCKNINNNNNNNQESNLNNFDNIHQNVRNIKDNYGNDFIVII